MENNIEKRVLENGMSVYFYLDESKHSTKVKLITKVGGQYKNFYMDGKKYHFNDGMAHFLEHLLLEHSQYGNICKLLGEHQMSCNGGTSPKITSFYFSTLKYLDFGIETLLKGINQPVFTKDDIESTKPAIYEEIRMRRDSIGRTLLETKHKNLYQKIDYINNLGSLKDIENITYEQAKLYYEAFYQPSNQILVIGGNFDLEHIWDLLQKVTSELPNFHHQITMLDYEEPKEVSKVRDIIKMPTGETTIEITYKVDISNMSEEQIRKNSYYFNYFSRMNFGKTSAIYEKLLKEKVIYNGIYTSSGRNENFVECTIGGSTEQTDKFINEVQKVLRNPVFDEELFNLYKNQDKMDLCCSYESYSYIMECLIGNIIGFHYENVDTVDDINALTFEEFKKVISSIDFKNYIIVILEDEEKK